MAIVRTQDRLLRLLGNSPSARSPLVATMLKRDASEATTYWLQLVVSVGIATLGLVVGSAAVVIGAMLVAPLMGPIVGLAMGLATGSPFLVLRSSGRIALSVVFAVGGAAIITLLLPFHELNSELAARTSPTVLDLITAGFCALAGVYAALRGGSDTATTAAGTSIGISLVPPLCASGYGFGTTAWPVAGGAALLFLTNLVAIVVVGTVAFVAAGFNRVDVVELESAELARDEEEAVVARRVARRLSSLFASKWGPVMRFLMPFALLAAVYVPLRRALDEVAWQVRVRSSVLEAIAREPRRVVQSRVRVERKEVDVQLVVLGKSSDAEQIRARLDGELRQASGVAPRIEVLAVPDADALAGLESSLATPRYFDRPIEVAVPTDEEQLRSQLERSRKALDGLWPRQARGAPLRIEIDTAANETLRLRVTHLGAPLTEDAREALERSVGAKLEQNVELVATALDDGELTRDGGDLRFIARVAAGLAQAASEPSIHVCVERPKPRERRNRNRGAAADAALFAALDPLLASSPRVTTSEGDEWKVQFLAGSCAKTGDSAAEEPARVRDAQPGGTLPRAPTAPPG